MSFKRAFALASSAVDVLDGLLTIELVALKVRTVCSAKTSALHTNPQLWDRPNSCPMIGQVPR